MNFSVCECVCVREGGGVSRRTTNNDLALAMSRLSSSTCLQQNLNGNHMQLAIIPNKNARFPKPP